MDRKWPETFGRNRCTAEGETAISADNVTETEVRSSCNIRRCLGSEVNRSVAGQSAALRSVSSCSCLLSPLRGSVSVLAHAGPCCLHRARVSTGVNPDSVTDELSYFVI